MILTRENIHAGASEQGGWTKQQLALLGVPTPPQKGWLTRLIGRHIDARTYREFMALKGSSRAGKRPKKPKEHPDLFSPQSPEEYANEMYLSSPDEFM